MRYAKTLKGLPPALVNQVTKEKARSVEEILKKRPKFLNHQSVT